MPWPSISSPVGFDLKESDPHDLPLADLSAQFRAERLQRERQAKLLALLSQAIGGRGVARRHRPGDGFQDRVRRFAGRRPRRAIAGQRLQLLFPDRVRQARRRQRLRVRAVERSQPGAEPAPAQFGRGARQALVAGGRAAALAADKARTPEEKIARDLHAGLFARPAAATRWPWPRRIWPKPRTKRPLTKTFSGP